MKIDFVIPVRDKEIGRIKKCIKSIKSEYTGDIYLVDYGSIKPIKIKDKQVTVIRYDGNKYFNKSHALNLGIKQCKNQYIATIDCDIILSDGFIEKAYQYLIDNVLIISRNIRRVDMEYTNNNFDIMWKYGRGWTKDGKWATHAVGGIQMFSKKWIHKIHGYNENLVLMGGMDSRVFDQAIMDFIPVIDINFPIIHQEHRNIKNRQFNNISDTFKLDILFKKAAYLNMLKKTYCINNKGKWGEAIPNQYMFLNTKKNKEDKKLILVKKKYNNAFIDAVKSGKKYFMFDNKKIEVFK